MSSSSDFDYIIVGGGTAGVVVASRLSQYDPETKVAILEHGPNAIDDPRVLNPFHYSTVPQPDCNDRKIWNPAGRMLSGSSGVNIAVWMRASSTDYALIAKRAGHERFKFENLLPFFKRTETYWDKTADANYHGFEGPIHTVGGVKFPLAEYVQTTASTLGHPIGDKAMQGDPTGLSELVQAWKATSATTSTRQHSAKVYDLSRVDVRCQSPVARVLFNGDKVATGVELVSGESLYARKEIIVSCGTQKTPQVLMLSGIGPYSELSKHGIEQITNSPGVGQNLFDHLSVGQYFKLKNPGKGFALPFEGTMKPEYRLGTPLDYNMSSNIPPSALKPSLIADKVLGAHDGTHPHLQSKRCHFMNLPLYLPILAVPEHFPDIEPLGGKHMAFTSLHLLPIARGTVTLCSANPNDEPVIDPKFLSTATDRFILRTAIRHTLLFTETSPLADEIEGETPPVGWRALTSKSTDEEIEDRMRQFTGTIAHPMGTCALGTVLDSEFRVKGVQGLRVCDASVLPEPIGAMPSQTVYALAELCADLIAGRALETVEVE
ncbi:mitochondrial putative choline dehydrogenase [Polyplosphaeria fusca]|uniref:Mitochondrial putative choline dehydrogenase n=1 Tax=Polyplosphaeria fusca TaxID=682080 RepID=A0A9P4V5F3_9PLEO|nr:mitochondrial putative choline dehydrogenase [Polyplosphaeria fusca]